MSFRYPYFANHNMETDSLTQAMKNMKLAAETPRGSTKSNNYSSQWMTTDNIKWEVLCAWEYLQNDWDHH